MIKDNVLQYSDFALLKMNCFSCNKRTHLISECPILHYMPNKEGLIKKFLFSVNQERKKV